MLFKCNRKKRNLIIRLLFDRAQFVKDNGSDVWIFDKDVHGKVRAYRVQMAQYDEKAVKMLFPDYRVTAEHIDINQDGQTIIARINNYSERKDKPQ